MITWLQNFFLKHNKWLFGGLLVVIIVTFVLTIGPQSFFGSSGPQKREAMNYYGYDLSSESDQRAMALTAEISAIFHPELQVRRNQIMEYAYLRVAALGIARQLGIPNPAEDDLRDYVETLLIFQDPQSGAFSPETYQSMLNALQANGRYSREAIGRVMREDYRIAQVRDALGGPAYTLPFEARIDYIDRETEYQVALLRYPYEDFSPEITPTDADLEQFYNENPARYEIPETISVSALFFTGEAYLEEVPDPSAEDLQSYFTANQSRYQPEAGDDAAEEEAAEVTLEDVRDEVLEDWRLEEAEEIAARKSEQFSVRLWQDGIPRESEAFDALVEEFKVAIMPVPDYSRGDAPRMGRVPAELLESMWIYTTNPSRYFSDIARNSSGAVVLVSNGLTESRMPAFEEVRDEVGEDFQQAEKRRLFSENGQELRQIIEERLSDESLEDVAGDLGLALEELDPFTGNEVPQQLRSGRIWDQTRFLEEGSVSPMVLQGTDGVFVCMLARSAPEIDTDSVEFQDFLASRSAAMNEAMGWARLREITDQSLNSLFGEGRMP